MEQLGSVYDCPNGRRFQPELRRNLLDRFMVGLIPFSSPGVVLPHLDGAADVLRHRRFLVGNPPPLVHHNDVVRVDVPPPVEIVKIVRIFPALRFVFAFICIMFHVVSVLGLAGPDNQPDFFVIAAPP